MSQSYKIAIAGIGGVGAFYGGLLAKAYEGSSDVSVSFVARGGHMEAIKRDGLQLVRDNETITAFPHAITDHPSELEKLDLVVFCCKAYDLEQLALSFAGNIDENTVLLPLLNGVDSTELLQHLFPGTKVLYGGTYLFARKISDGVIKITGDLNLLLLGAAEADQKELEQVAGLFQTAGVNVNASEDIRVKLWEKFSFISPMATATSAFDNVVAELLGDEEKKQTLQQLMEELVLLSTYEMVALPEDIIAINLGKMSKLHAEATSSMHSDFKAGNRTELETLTGYVVRKAEKYGIHTPTYDRLYAQLKDRNK